jgi:hypothetical protein
MRTVFENLLDFNPQNSSSLVLLLGCGVWVVMWVVLMIDIVKQRRSGLWTGFWLLIASVPLLGSVLYALEELLVADWRAAFSWRKHDVSKRAGS